MLAIENSSRIPLITDTPTMILGMDVSHGSPGRSDIPSIAAVISHVLSFKHIWAICLAFSYHVVAFLQYVGTFRLLALDVGHSFQGIGHL